MQSGAQRALGVPGTVTEVLHAAKADSVIVKTEEELNNYLNRNNRGIFLLVQIVSI